MFTYLLTYLLTYSLTHSLIHLLTYLHYPSSFSLAVPAFSCSPAQFPLYGLTSYSGVIHSQYVSQPLQSSFFNDVQRRRLSCANFISVFAAFPGAERIDVINVFLRSLFGSRFLRF